eukprot:8380196-Pyramimonas_sp.AAC.1
MTFVSQIVHLSSVEQDARNTQHMVWNIIFPQEWTAYEMASSHNKIRTLVFSDEEVADVGQSTLSEDDKALIMRNMRTADGTYICHQYRAVSAGFGYCLQCLTPFMYTHSARVNYLTPLGRNALVAAWASLGLTPRLDAPPRGESCSNIISNRLRATKELSRCAGKITQS